MIKIVADENIPHVEYYFGHDATILLKPGRSISHQDVKNADILLVRSVTPVNQTLLQNTSVKFVGSTTTGTDHLDIPWLEKNNIRWAAAKGCNAVAVVEYIISIIAALRSLGLLSTHLRAGVMGVGEIGSKVVAALKKLNIDVIQCDPIRAEKEIDFVSTPVSDFRDLDLITLHTPLHSSGPYSTFHLIEKNFLIRQKPGCFLLNTSRGSAIHSADLKQYGKHLQWCLDVWENEPNIDLAILQSATIATPHIAGYSVQSKFRGIEMVYQAAIAQQVIPDRSIVPITFPRKKIIAEEAIQQEYEKILKIYNPLETSDQMKYALLSKKESFDELRKNFPERYEFDFVDFICPEKFPKK